MSSVASIQAIVQFLLDETGGPASTGFITLYNRAQREIAKETGCFVDEITTASKTTDNTYAMPDKMFKVKDVRFYDKDSVSKIVPMPKDEFEARHDSTTDTVYSYYMQDGRTIWFSPRLSVGASSILCSGDVTSSATVIPTIGSVSSFPTYGKIEVTSGSVTECIRYNGQSSGFINCVRGAEGTTPVSIASGSSLTERDIKFSYYRLPTDISSLTTSVETVFDLFPDVLAYWICHQAKVADTDDVQPTGTWQQAQYFKGKYDEEKAKLQNYMKANSDQTFSIKRVK